MMKRAAQIHIPTPGDVPDQDEDIHRGGDHSPDLLKNVEVGAW